MCDPPKEAVVGTFSTDALVGYTETTKSDFETTVLKGLRSLFSECHAIRDYASATPELSKNHTELVHSIANIVSKVWEMLQKAERFDKRLDGQTQRVKEKLASTVAKPCLKKPKSKKRQDAGKRKAGSLKAWHAEVKAARKALKDTGYTGSFLFKKGMPMYTKIQELRLASHATMSTPVPSVSESRTPQPL